MQFRPSAQYIEQLCNGQWRVIVMLAGVMCLFVWLSFFGPAKDPDPLRSMSVLAVISVMLEVIGFVQVRRLRKSAADLAAVWFELTDEGLSVDSPSGRWVLRYEGIRAVSIYRRFFSVPIARIVLHGQAGKAAFPGLEKPEEFIAALKQHLSGDKFREKRGVFV